MRITRLREARPYEAAKHHGTVALRLQGMDVTPAETFWVGLSHFLPGGGAEYDATPLEKVYVVVSGEVTVKTDDAEVTLQPFDSCYLAPGEARVVENRTNLPASMLVIMPKPGGAGR
jgi:mannose-6-phosphate isomerase-like protein (cupin superfamily)